LLGVQREEICEPHSNLFWWKIAKPKFVTHIANLMANYKILGPKPDKHRAFN